VQCLLQIEEAVPYFQRAVCLSGARAGLASPNDTRENSRKTAKAILDELGITRENIQKIYDVPYADIVDACWKVSDPFHFSPVPNDDFPGFPALTHLMPFSKDKPILYSTMIGELPICDLTGDQKEAMTEDDWMAFFRDRFGEHTDRVIELFREAYPDHDLQDLAYLDTRYRTSAVRSAMKHIEAGCKDVYLMLCAYTVPENGRTPIWHGGEVAYIFKNEDKVLVLNDAENGQKYANALNGLMLNFVRTGNPNCEYLPEWKKATAEDNWTMIIDRECRCVAHHDDALAELHNEVGPALFKLKLSKD
jgi:para-nitrobenzyl esterase